MEEQTDILDITFLVCEIFLSSINISNSVKNSYLRMMNINIFEIKQYHAG